MHLLQHTLQQQSTNMSPTSKTPNKGARTAPKKCKLPKVSQSLFENAPTTRTRSSVTLTAAEARPIVHPPVAKVAVVAIGDALRAGPLEPEQPDRELLLPPAPLKIEERKKSQGGNDFVARVRIQLEIDATATAHPRCHGKSAHTRTVTKEQDPTAMPERITAAHSHAWAKTRHRSA